jgi:hypothetical protein
MTECMQFFEGLDRECEEKQSSSIRGDRLRAMGAERLQRLIDWEGQTASRFSPGIVNTSEKIRKALFQGQDIVEGAIHRNTFSTLKELGLSADRIDKTDESQCKSHFDAIAAEKGKTLYGYIDLSVASLRAMFCKMKDADANEKAKRAIAVYDTARSDNPVHAEAFMIVKFSGTKPYKTIQANMYEEYRGHVRRY